MMTSLSKGPTLDVHQGTRLTWSKAIRRISKCHQASTDGYRLHALGRSEDLHILLHSRREERRWNVLVSFLMLDTIIDGEFVNEIRRSLKRSKNLPEAPMGGLSQLKLLQPGGPRLQLPFIWMAESWLQNSTSGPKHLRPDPSLGKRW